MTRDCMTLLVQSAKRKILFTDNTLLLRRLFGMMDKRRLRCKYAVREGGSRADSRPVCRKGLRGIATNKREKPLYIKSPFRRFLLFLLGTGEPPPPQRIGNVGQPSQLALRHDGRQTVPFPVRENRGSRRSEDAVRNSEEVSQGDAVDQVGHFGHRDFATVDLDLALCGARWIEDQLPGREWRGERGREREGRAGALTPRSSTWTIRLSSAIAKLLFNWFLARLSSSSVTPFFIGLVTASNCCAKSSGVRYKKDGSTEMEMPKSPLSR